jgi:hypothetical protein
MDNTLTFAMQHYGALMQTLPISPTSWISLATIAVLTVILVAIMVYMLSNITNSQYAKAWSRFQIYEAMVSLLLIAVFGTISFLLFLNPQTVFNSMKLVPSTCTGATQLYTLAACDIGTFDSAAFGFANYLFWGNFIFSLIGGFSPNFKVDPLGSDFISFSISVPQIVPANIDNTLSALYALLLFTLIFNQLQLIMISAAVFFLGFFITIGLIARTLGFLRTFGGAMIAFGMGLGIIYPLLVAMTYGYIDVSANLACIQTITCGVGAVWGGLIAALYAGSGSIPAAVGTLYLYISYILAGLTVVPLLNIVIVDAFIIDFSSAIGERMSFGQLFSSLL